MARIALGVALGLGASGAMIDVSSYVQLERGIERSYGRTRQYDDIEPGQFSFVLENADGRFTPDNAASPYATKLVEGMPACVSVGGRLTPGRVQTIEPTFPEGEPNRAQVLVSGEDMLGTGSRDTLDAGWRDALVRAGTPRGYYPFDDPEDAPAAADQSGLGAGRILFTTYLGTVTFGEAGAEHDRVRITGDGDARIVGADDYVIASARYMSFWLQPIETTGTLAIRIGHYTFRQTAGQLQLSNPIDTVTMADPIIAGREYFVEVDQIARTLTVDGVLIGACSTGFISGPAPVDSNPIALEWGLTAGTDVYLSDLAFTDARVRGDLLQAATNNGGATQWLELVEGINTTFTFSALPTGLNPSPLSVDGSGASLLSVINDVLTAEQGHAYSVGAGTLTAPTESVVVRARDRAQTVTASFDVAADLGLAPAFERPIRDLVSRVEARTPSARVVVTNADVAARAGSSSTSAQLPFVLDGAARSWAEDRILRGANTRLQATRIVIDAMTTQTDRSADLLALVPGDRIRLTNLPSTQLGYTTWDAWIVGAKETHNLTEHTFEFYIAPVLDPPALFGTDRFATGGRCTLGRSVRTNLVRNPSFETNVSLWSTTGTSFTRITTDSFAGLACGQLLAAAVNNAALTTETGLAASRTYSASAWVKGEAGKTARIDLRELTGAGVTVGDTAGPFVTMTGAWQRVSVSRAFGATGAQASILIRNTHAGAHTILIDAVHLEESTTGPYFDGATVDTATESYDWLGPVHASRSTERAAAMTAAATSIEAATAGALLSLSAVPYVIEIDDEQLTVTAVTGSSSPQLLTVSRGANGTTPAAHTEGAAIELVPTARFVF